MATGRRKKTEEEMRRELQLAAQKRARKDMSRQAIANNITNMPITQASSRYTESQPQYQQTAKKVEQATGINPTRTVIKTSSGSSRPGTLRSSGIGRSNVQTNTIRPDTTVRLAGNNGLAKLGTLGGRTTRDQWVADRDRMRQNSVRWHFAGTDEREKLKQENDAIRSAYGLRYKPSTGETYAGTVNLSKDVGDTVDEYRQQGVMSTVGHNTGSALAGVNEAFYKTVDFLLPDVITPDFIQDYIDEAKKNSEDIQQKVDNYNYGRGGTIGGVAGELYQSALEMAPQAVIALMTGNLSTGAQLADAGKNAVSKVVQQVTKSPAAWASFFQTVGSDYEEAKANGASDLEAAASAIISSAINAGVETSGGIETAGARPKNILNWLKGMNEEGREEVVQGVVSGLTQKGIYDADRPWLTTGSGEGVIDPVRMAQEYGAGALIGGVMTAPGTFAGRRSTGAQAAQETPAAPRAGNYSPVMQETVRGDFAKNENSPVSTEPVRAGRVTTIQSLYTGKTPVNVSAQTQGQALSISPETVDSARQAIFASQQSGTFARTIKSVLQSIFQQQGGPRSVRVQGVTFDGQPYEVVLHGNAVAKIASDPNMSAEKLAAFNDLDSAVATAEYVGSGNYNKNKSKAAKVIRYDYFEKPLKINGKDYVMSFDVEVYPGTNNFRTYKVINQIDLTPATAIRRSTTGGHIAMQSGLPNNSISQIDGNSNPAQTDAQTLAVRLAGLDSAMRTAENLLPGPARDARIAEIRAEMEETAELLKNGRVVETNSQGEQRQNRDLEKAALTMDENEFFEYYRYVTEEWDMTPEEARAMQEAFIEQNRLDRIGAMAAHAKENAIDVDAQFVPINKAFTYGMTPEQAMREAEVRAQGEAKRAAYQSEREETVDELMQAWTDKRAAEKQAEQTLAGLTLTDNDIRLAQNAAMSGVDTVNWEYADNPEKAYLYGKTLRAVREADQPIRQYFARRAAAMQSEAQKAADAIATHAKDKRWGAAYQRETMERNIRDIFGKEHQAEAEAIIREYITPVHQAVAEGNKLKNSLRDRVKKLGLNKHERALVQMRLEAEYGAAAEYIKNNDLTVTPEMDAKINQAVQVFRDIYNDLYNQINETLLLNGQEPAPFRKNYAPHFTKDKPDTLLGKVRFALGLGKDSNLNLPTDIAGITDSFRPGKKWFGNLLQREGEITDYDAVAGFDQYVETAADVITLTESIQKLRALEDQVRYTLSDEGVQAKIDAIRANPELEALQQRQQIEEVYDTNRSSAQQLIDDLRNQKRMGMGRFVTELRRYTDNLAGKKSREDRGWEDMANRQVYQLAKNLESRVAANMISLNPGSWLTNLIPITQATGEVSVPNLVKGMYQTVKGAVTDDGYRDASAFLTNRYGSDRLDKTLAQRASDLSGAPMELIDHFVANTIHRARYAQNIDKGMSMDAAIEDADAYTASLMADRSKGALPTAFNATNPIRKVFTMFQTEVNNQLSYLFKDMPKAQREKGVAAVAWAYTKVFGTAYLFNLAYSALTGRDAALDPVGIIADALGIGDDEDEERSGWDVAADLGMGVAQNLPFVGGLLDGGRVPISSAFPNPVTIWNSLSGDAAPEKKAQTVGKELAKPLTYLLPKFGGGAARRGIEGYATIDAGGSYTYDSDGNRVLQFPAYGQKPQDYARAMLFGKWSSEEAQEYIDNGFKGLSADETVVFDQLRNDMGVDARQAMDTILSLRGFESDKDGETGLSVKDQQRLTLFDNENLTPEQKAAVDRALIVSGEDEQPADYSDRNTFLLGQYVSEGRRDAARDAIATGLSIDQFVQWDDRLSNLTGEENSNGNKVRTEAEARNIVLDEVMQDTMLSDSEKQAIADYVLISSIGEEDEKTREDWENIAKGKVNATDYLRFKDDVSIYEKQAKGSGTDNMANVAEILRGYDGLTDQERDVLFQTFNSTMKNNPFHVSEYEQAVQDNQFYKDLSEEGKSALRALTNEYEQAVNDGKELKDWVAKAYMADKEADIAPGVYALYRVALQTINAQASSDDYYSQDEVKAAVNTIPGLTQYQKAYLWQSANKKWKKNPFGSATVGEYQSGVQEAINPVESGTQTSAFGPREAPTAGASTWHDGLDIAASEGEPVKAILSGKVVAKSNDSSSGYYVKIDHGDGRVSTYMHMQPGSTDGINVGDEIEQGQQIGAVGNTGISTGPHLDIRITKDGKYIDPLTVIPGYGVGPSGYVSGNTASSSTVASGVAAAKAAKNSGSTGSSGLKSLDDLLKLDGLF